MAGRGGAREGAGQKPRGNAGARIKTSITLDPELIEWLKGFDCSRSDAINNALRLVKTIQESGVELSGIQLC